MSYIKVDRKSGGKWKSTYSHIPETLYYFNNENDGILGINSFQFTTWVQWSLTDEKQDTLDEDSPVFSGKLHLKCLIHFAENFTNGILNAKQQIILIIFHSLINAYVGEFYTSLEIIKIE